MRARVPLDIDLEDRLVYGLTPMRLAYVVLAGLGAMAVWSAHDIFPPLRVLAVVVLMAAGAALAWGRIGGRPADEWVVDLALYLSRTRRLAWRREE